MLCIVQCKVEAKRADDLWHEGDVGREGMGAKKGKANLACSLQQSSQMVGA